MEPDFYGFIGGIVIAMGMILYIIFTKKPETIQEALKSQPHNGPNENPSKPGYYRVTAEITGSDTVSKLDTTVYAYDEGDAYNKAKRYRTIKLRKEEDHGKS